MNRKALGRGLGALLSSDRTIDLGSEPTEVETESIVPGSMQPRTHFDEASLQGLAESIRSHGIVQPLLVRRRGDRYELIAGERRWRAARLAGLAKVPVVVKEVPDDNLLEIALIENIQREDLNPIEEAQAYKKLIETVGLTQEALAGRVGRDRSYITNYLRLLRLPDDLQQLLIEGRLSTGHARTLLALSHVDQQRRMARKIIDDGLSVRATERAARWAGAQTKPRKARRVDPALADRARKALESITGANVKVTDTRIEIPFADEVALAELVESLEARN